MGWKELNLMADLQFGSDTSAVRHSSTASQSATNK
jgi:hypothetical protein